MITKVATRICVAAFGLVLLSSCAIPVPTASESEVINTDTFRVQHEIVGVCVASGLFRSIGTAVLSAVPYGSLATTLINAGVDQVCANPASFARDASTVKWLAQHFEQKIGR